MLITKTQEEIENVEKQINTIKEKNQDNATPLFNTNTDTDLRMDIKFTTNASILLNEESKSEQAKVIDVVKETKSIEKLDKKGLTKDKNEKKPRRSSRVPTKNISKYSSDHFLTTPEQLRNITKGKNKLLVTASTSHVISNKKNSGVLQTNDNTLNILSNKNGIISPIKSNLSIQKQEKVQKMSRVYKKPKRERFSLNYQTQTFFDNVDIDDIKYKIGDCVLLKTKSQFKKVGRINAIYDEIFYKKNKPKTQKNLITQKKILIGCYFNCQKYAQNIPYSFAKHELLATRRNKVYSCDDIIRKCYVVGFSQYNRIKTLKKFQKLLKNKNLINKTSLPSALLNNEIFNSNIIPMAFQSKLLYFCRSLINVSNLSITPFRFKY